MACIHDCEIMAHHAHDFTVMNTRQCNTVINGSLFQGWLKPISVYCVNTTLLQYYARGPYAIYGLGTRSYTTPQGTLWDLIR